MKKQLPAILAATIMTFLVGAAILLIGGNALMNPSSVAAKDAPGTSGQIANNLVSDSASTQAAQLQQLQSLVSQYQQREQQYQAQLDTAKQQLDQASSQIEQYQNVLQFLVDRGVIQVNARGQILVPQTGNRGNGEFDDDH